MPGTPATLSLVSPTSASTSTTCSGLTPNFSTTPCSSNHVPSSRGSYTRMPLPTSWKKSLSIDTTTTSNPESTARMASVPITSSASYPSFVTIGTPSASHAWCTELICSARSSGIAARFAL